MPVSRLKLSRLYEADETAWLEQMAQLIADRQYDKLDYKNLKEYLLDMARRDRRQVMSRLKVLLGHLLKWQHQPTKQSRSWKITIEGQRDDLRDLLASQTLKNHAVEILPEAYARAVLKASAETGLAEEEFPKECPFTIEQLLTGE